MIVLAIDPGIEGAWAFHYERGLPPYMDDLPIMGAKTSRQINAAQLAEDWRSLIRVNGKPAAAIVEDVHAMPKQGVTSSFKFGQAKGTLLGLLAAMEIPVFLPSPASWKAKMKLDSEGETSRLAALQRWPTLHQKLRLKKSHNMAEAALLGAWFYEHHPAGRGQEKVLTAQNFW